MGVIIPQVVSATEDRASGAQVIDGGLRFDSSKSQYLNRTPGSAGNRTTWTWSGWIKRNKLSTFPDNNNHIFSAGSNVFSLRLDANDGSNRIEIFNYNGSTYDFQLITTQVFRDFSAWFHLVLVLDTSNATSSDRVRLYINGQRVTVFSTSTYPSSSFTAGVNNNTEHRIGSTIAGTNYLSAQLSNVYLIDGQALDPSYFGYTDALTNTWRPKKYVRTTTITGDTGSAVGFGTNGFYLPFDGNSPIGQDMSGKGNNWTPVNFGGSNTIEKATGALPILNTDGGGKVARVGVRTDSNASSLVLALPLVGIKSDFSNAINSGTSNKTVTASGASSSSAQSNFYGGSFYFNGSGQYLELNDSEDWNFGSGDFTIEFWTYIQATGTSPAILSQYPSDADPAQDSFFFSVNTNTPYFYYYGTSNGSLNGGNVPTQTWAHLAVTRSGNTWRLFVNGVIVSTQTISITLNNSTGKLRVGASESGSYPFNGYVQDLRIYKGVAKYTQNFIPASTDPDILPDTPSGVAYSSNVALVPSTDGAAAFNGSTQYLSLADSADWAFGSGDFTIETFIYYNSGSTIYFGQGDGGTPAFVVYGNSVYIGPGVWTAQLTFTNPPSNKWFHFALVRSGNTLTVYIDGINSGSLAYSSSWPDATDSFTIGEARNAYTSGFYSNFHIVKGTALYTSNFTPPTGPISSVANTKLLCCKSNSSATAFDVSPGSITANGNAVASNFNPFTVNINTQRGQESSYATLNPLDNQGNTLSNGNLVASQTTSSWYSTKSNISVSSGKWYYEATVLVNSGGNYQFFGVYKSDVAFPAVGANGYIGYSASGWAVQTDGRVWNNASSTTPLGTASVGDTLMIAFDVDNSKIWFGLNGIWYGSPATGSGAPFTNLTSPLSPAISLYATQTCSLNFGQKPFKFPPPAGFQPLALANTPRPTIVRPDQYVGIATWTGNGGTQSINTGFKPDFVWIKDRTNGYNHVLFDSVRGTGGSKVLFSNRTTAEGGGTGEEGTVYGHVSSFDTYGFSVSPGSGAPLWVSNSGDNYVSWAWKAGGNSNTYNINDVGYATASAAGLSAGTITPSGASVNTKSGFSILTYTGNNTAGATISHGLGRAPAFAIFKNRGASSDWQVYHQSLGNATSIILQTTAAAGSSSAFNSTSPTSTLFTFGQGTSLNSSGGTHIGYLWAEIPGFSKFGSYTGNGSADGTMVVTGFRPRWLMIKQSSASGENWRIFDTTRDPYNAAQNRLLANSAATEGVGVANELDILSNGFKLRSTDGASNGSGATYIYAAFAEAPSFNLYGGQANAR